MIVIFDEE